MDIRYTFGVSNRLSGTAEPGMTVAMLMLHICVSSLRRRVDHCWRKAIGYPC